MNTHNETDKINCFLTFMSPMMVQLVEKILRSAHLDFKEKGAGLDLAFTIKSGENEVKFYLHNLLLEIATVDRDQHPLRFDAGLKDADYLVDKISRLTHSKLRILFQFLQADDVEAAIDKICRETRHYERLRICKFDRPGK